MKLLAAIAVVAIHVQPISLDGRKGLYSYLLTLAVPFFFSFSGYMIAERNSDIRKVLNKNIRLYILWSIIYSPVAIGHYLYLNNSLKITILKIVRGYFLLGEQFYSWQLWYLLSIVYGLLTIRLLGLLKRSPIFLLILSISIFSMGYLISYFSEMSIGLFGRIVSESIGSGRIFTGLSYLLLGYLTQCFHKNKIFRKVAIIFIFVSFISAIIGLVKYSTTSWAAYMAIPCLLLISTEIKGKNSYLVCARMVSSTIYFTHMIFFFLFSCDLTHFIVLENYHPIKAFFLTLICSIAAGLIYFPYKNMMHAKIIDRKSSY